MPVILPRREVGIVRGDVGPFSDVGPAWHTAAMPDERSISEKLQAKRNEKSMKASADAAKITARSVDQMLDLSAAQLKLTRAQLELSKQARADADRSERFTRWMTIVSVAIAVGSLGTSIVAIIVVGG
jgi:hypothetical protein